MLRIGIAQINVTVGDFSGNQRKIEGEIVSAQKNQCDLVVFPELVICGYPPEDLLYKDHFVDENLRVLKELLPKTKNLTAVIGFVDRDKNGNLFNAAAVVSDGKLKAICHKQDLPNYSVFDEKRYFTKGKNDILFSLNDTIIGVNVCEDIWSNHGKAVEQAKKGAQVLINISSSPYYDGKVELREKMLKARAKQTKAFICYANLVGGQDELVFDGTSFVFDPNGKIIARAQQFEEDFLICDLDVPIRRGWKRKGSKIISLKDSGPKEIIHNLLATKFEKNAEIYQALVLGTRDYIQKNGFKKVVIGLSGGIDSALVALIAVDAIGAENVTGISMPSRFSSKETRNDARILAENLRIKFIEIAIEGVFKSYLSTLEPEFQGHPADITEENLQARIRGNILMAFSNKFGWLVLTTGNKSEFSVGYCTLYGDMSGGFAVLKDVPKMLVYELSKFRNEHTKFIPESIIERAPTAELRENQKDEDSLPPYSVLDLILKHYVEGHQSLKKIGKNSKLKNLPKGQAEEILKKVSQLVDKSEYKRRQSPPGVKITPRAFGKDWRLPITNKFREI